MVLGIGVDIININRIKSIIDNTGNIFIDKVFTLWEQQRAAIHPDAISYFAMTFAAKESIFKCFGIGWESGVKLTEIEIRDGKFGEPIPVLTGTFAELARERGVTSVLLSLSYETDYAVGSATLVSDKAS